jgi:Spy/CpxP family protein refolding chaperone
MNRIKTTFMIIAFVAATGMVSMAFAHGGGDGDDYGGHMGYGGYMMGPGMMGYGYDMGPGMMGYGPGYGRWGRGGNAANISREDSIKLQQARDKFIDETRPLRNEIQDKQFALNDALDSANPDKAKVTDLQKEISQLQSQYDQKALAYRLEVRKLLPESADRGDYGYGPGYGGCRW